MSETISTVKKARVEYVDSMRGLCILMVSYFHSGISLFLAKYVSNICVHPFLFMAGYFYSRKLSFRENIIKKSRSTLAPYYFFGLVYYIIWLAAMAAPGKNIIAPLIAVLYMPTSSFPVESAIYFLPMMFFAIIIFCAIEKTVRSEPIRAILVIAITLAGNLWYHCTAVRLPLSLDTSMSVLIYVYLGYHGRTILGFIDAQLLKIKRRAVKIAIFLSVSLINFILIDISPIPNIRNGEWGIIPLSHLNTVMTMILWVYFFRWFDSLSSMKSVNRALQFIGKNSMIFMCFNHIGLTIAQFIAYRLPLPMFGCKLIHYVLSIVVVIPVVFVFNKTKLHLIFGK
ncbi:MAG: acyltransferase family protein [Eubacteriales bacterium]|nr:acyltransferase family protein [Eubacteriales bacterium]